MDVTTAAQGSRAEVDGKVRKMLTLDGWQPDMDLAARAGYLALSQTRGLVRGGTDT